MTSFYGETNMSRKLIVLTCLTAGLLIMSSNAQTLATGDSRSVSQPTTPSACETLSAQFTSSAVDVNTPTTSDDTSRVQAALTACENTGKAVVLAASGSNNAFLTGKLTLETDEALVIDSGVTLYGNNSYNSESRTHLCYRQQQHRHLRPRHDRRTRQRAHLFSDTPRLVQTDGAEQLHHRYNITLQNAAHPNLYIQGGSGATVWSVTINTSPTQKPTPTASTSTASKTSQSTLPTSPPATTASPSRPTRALPRTSP
jgi:polygalacturonase